MKSRPVFINCSGQPTSSWGKKQLRAAKRLGEVHDIPFPDIPTKAGVDNIRKIMPDFLEKVEKVAGGKKKMMDIFLHVAGDPTFMCLLVQELAYTSAHYDVYNDPDGHEERFGPLSVMVTFVFSVFKNGEFVKFRRVE